MSYLCYNGIVLEVIKSNRVEMTSIYSDDGIDFHYTHVYIDVDAVINPRFSTFFIDNNGCLNFNVAQEEDATVGPFQSTQSIRQYLMTPRGQLIFSEVALGYRFLSSPAPGYDIDCNGGPKPISFSIIRIDGFRTFHVRFAIETWINECPVFQFYGGGPPIPILSNRFSVSHTIDKQYLLHKVTSGVAVFRTDVLRGNPQNPGVQLPDLWREQLLPPVSIGLQRTEVNINVNSKGNMLQWSVRDVEKMYELGDPSDPNSLSASGIIDLEGNISMTTFGTDGSATYGTNVIFTASARGQYLSRNWNIFVNLLKMSAYYLRPPGQPALNGMVKNVQVQTSITDAYVSLAVHFYAVPKQVWGGGLTPPVQLIQTDRVGIPTDARFNPAPPLGKGIGSLNEAINVKTIITESIRQCMNVGESLDFLYAEGTLPADAQIIGAKLQCVVSNPANPGPLNYGVSSGANPYGLLPQPSPQININQTLQQQQSHYSSGMQSVPITHYKVTNKNSKDTGRRHLPVAGDVSTTPEVVRICSPMSVVSIDWTSENFGTDVAPLPHPIINDKNMYLISSEIEPQAIEMLPDQSGVAVRVSGRYNYLAKNTVGAGDSIPLVCPPWFDVGYGFVAIKSDTYQHGIIDDPNGSQGNV